MHLKHVAIFLLIVMLAGTASAVTTIPAGYVNAYSLSSTNTEYRLAGNVTANATAFNVAAANVTLDGMGHTIFYAKKEWGRGIDVNGQNYAKIKNVTFVETDNYAFSHAIRLSNAQYCNVSNVNIDSDNGFGVYVSGAAKYNTIHDCNIVVANANYGIQMIASNNNTVDGCTVTSPANIALYLTTSHNNSILDSSLISTSSYGIVLLNSNNNSIDSTTASSAITGIWFNHAQYNTINNSNMIGGTYYGAYLYNYTQYNVFTDSNFESNTNKGLYLIKSRYNSFNNITSTTSASNQTATLVGSSNANTFVSSSFFGNLLQSVGVYNSTGNIFSDIRTQSRIDSTPHSRHDILTYGDSVTAGGATGVPFGAWGLNLSTYLNQSSDWWVSNQGYGGERANIGLARLNQTLDIYNPQYLSIMYGANDLSHDYNRPQQDIIDDVLEMATIAKNRGITPYILLPPPTQYITSKMVRYNQNLSTQATAEGFDVINVYDAIDTVPGNGVYDGYNSTNYVADAVHPNNVGNTLIANTIYNNFYENEIKRKNGLYLGYTSAWNGTWWNIIGTGPDDNWEYIGDEIEVTVS